MIAVDMYLSLVPDMVKLYFYINPIFKLNHTISNKSNHSSHIYHLAFLTL